MKDIDFLKFVVFSHPRSSGIIMCRYSEIEELYNTIIDSFSPHVNGMHHNGVASFSFRNDFRLYIMVYSREAICGVRGDFVMVTDESIAAGDMLQKVILPLLICPMNIAERIKQMEMARTVGVELEVNDGRRLEPFVYAIAQQKFLTPMPMRSQNPHS